MNDELSSLKASIVNLKSSIQVFITHHGVVASTTADASLVYSNVEKLGQKINDLETLHEEYKYALSEYGNPTNWDIAYTEGYYFYRTLYPWILAQESLKSLHEKKKDKINALLKQVEELIKNDSSLKDYVLMMLTDD